jgi:HisJ family histidinol phosphate phosphatase
VQTERDPRLNAIPDIHGHAKGEHKPYAEERPLPLTARMLFLWFYHACRRGYPRFLMVSDHINFLTFEDPASVNLVRRALKLAQAGDLYGAAETANVDVGHAQVVSEGLRRGMRYSIGAEVDNDPRARPDAQNIVDAMRPDGLIRSVHFIPIDHPVHGPNWNWAFDNPEYVALFDHVGTEKTWELYMSVLLDAIDRLPGQVVGHFYVPAVFGHWPDDATLDRYEDQLLDAVAARGMAIEFNTRFLYRDHPDEQKQRYLEANKRLLRKAKDRGVGIAVGSDAHSPRDQGMSFEPVLAILDELDINELVFPIAGRLARVALRYVKPAEPEPPPAPPEPVAVAAAAEPVAEAEGTAALERTAEHDEPAIVPVAAAPAKKRTAKPKARPVAPDVPAEITAESAAPADAEAVSEPVDATPAPAEPAVVAAVEATAETEPRQAAVKARKPAKAPPPPKPSPAAKAAKPKAPAKPAPKPAAKKAAAKPAKAAVKVAKKAAPVKKAAAAKKTAVKKVVAKKAPPKKTVAKKAAPAKKAPIKKAAAKKSPSRIVAKRAPAKKAAVRKAVAKKPTPKKPAAKRR